MKVIAIMDFVTSPLSTATGSIKEGGIYTVKSEQSGYSEFGKRWVDAYEFEGIDGLFEQGIFIPLSNIDEMLLVCLRAKPLRKKKVLNNSKIF
jgi:hypothetical protein